jgi:hypothetical protein
VDLDCRICHSVFLPRGRKVVAQMKIPSFLVAIVVTSFFGLQSWTLWEVVGLKVALADTSATLEYHIKTDKQP